MLRTTTNRPDDLSLLSRVGVSGQPIPTHRSIHRLIFPGDRLLVIFLLPIAFDVALFSIYQPVMVGWKLFLEFWVQRIDLGGTVTLDRTSYEWISFALPHMDMVAPYPSRSVWYVTSGITMLLFAAAMKISDKYLPFRYFLNLVVFIQFTAIAFFGFYGYSFPYDLTSYIDMQLLTASCFIFVVPWIHAVIYYTMDFSILKKVALTLITIAFLMVALPFQMMAQAYLIMKCSLIVVPILFLMFGMFPVVLECVALYGWGMSWKSPRKGVSFSD